MNRVKIIGVDISATNMDECLQYLKDNIALAKGNYICACNVHTTVMAKENASYMDIQNHSFMSLPDGKPLSIVGRYKGYKAMDRVTGPEFMENVLSLSEEYGWTHFFYGNTKENLDILISYLQKKYISIKIAGYEPSVFRTLQECEEMELVEQIIKSKADFVWVGLGAPRQEVFCAHLASMTNAVWVGVGGAFNVVSGVIPRAPMWMQKFCLEWFYRWTKEPKRLFKRYFVTNIKFILYVIFDLLKIKRK